MFEQSLKQKKKIEYRNLDGQKKKKTSHIKSY